MPSKPGRPPVSTSFKKGQKAALGNDKTLRLSTWIDKQLNSVPIVTTDDYGTMMSKREVLAHKIVETAITTKDPSLRLAYFKEIADRTEGRPQQSLDVTSQGKQVGSLNTEEAIDRLREIEQEGTAQGTDLLS